jgi:hypothetical protein
MDEQERKIQTVERLKHSIQALALPAAAQVLQFPDFVVKTDELILDFDDWSDCPITKYRNDITPAQLASLEAIVAYIDKAESAGGKSVWEEEALYSHPFWEELRRLAIRSLGEFGWPAEIPPSYAHEYVRSKQPPIV